MECTSSGRRATAPHQPAPRATAPTASPRAARRPDYLKRNLWVTTSGQCDNVPLLAAIGALGSARVMFAVDHPYEDSLIAGRSLDEALIDAAIHEQVARGHAVGLMRLRA